MKKVFALVVIGICAFSQPTLAQEEASEVQKAEKEMAEAEAKLQLLRSQPATAPSTKNVDVLKLKELVKEKKIAEEAYVEEAGRQSVINIIAVSGGFTSMAGLGLMLPLVIDSQAGTLPSAGGVAGILMGSGLFLCWHQRHTRQRFI